VGFVRVLGIDPGLAITGYGLVDEAGADYRWVASGCIRTGAEVPPALRLAQIFDRTMELIGLYRPRVLALEKLFFSRNVRTALQVGEARGIVILAAARSSLELFEYTPLQVKQAVAGYGRAEKDQVQTMIRLLLCLQASPAVDDEADALAVAICHLQHRRWVDAVKGGGSRQR
jgi:crossover junction endodeoxyribonuclease RuvC